MTQRQRAAFKRKYKWRRIPEPGWKSVHKASNEKARDYLIQYNRRKYKLDKLSAQFRIKEPFLFTNFRRIKIDMPYPDDPKASLYDIWDDVEPYIGNGNEFWVDYPITVKTEYTMIHNYLRTPTMTVYSQDEFVNSVLLYVLNTADQISGKYLLVVQGFEDVEEVDFVPGVDHIILNVKI